MTMAPPSIGSLLIIALTAGVFTLDLATPLGWADGFLYLVPLILLSRSPQHRHLVGFAALYCGLIIAGWILSPPGGATGPVTYNRSMGIALLGITALFLRHRKQVEEMLCHSQEALERQVEARTTEFRKVIGLLKSEIAERRQAEESLRQSEERLRLLMDHANDAIVYLDLNGVIQWASVQITALAGRPMTELIGSPVMSVLTPDAAASAEARLAAVRRGEAIPPLVEFSILRPDGDLVMVEANITSVQGLDGVAGRLLVLRDITERRQAEKALQESVTRHRAILDSAMDAVITITHEGRIVEFNPAAEVMFGYTRGMVIGKEMVEYIIPPSLRERHRMGMARYLATGRTSIIGKRIEITALHADGAEFPVELTITRIGLGGRTFFTAYIRDITARKLAEEGLKVRSLQQAAVAELGLFALTHSDLQQLMEQAVALVSQTLGMEYSKVLELLPEGDRLLLRAGVGWKEGYVGHATVDTGYDSQAGYTLLSGAPVVVKDLRTETRFRGPQILHDHGVVSGMSVVIQGQGSLWGVLGTHTRRQRTFGKDDIHFLQAIANVLATAIERKRTEDAVRAMVTGTASVTGEEFFPTFVCQLAAALRVRYAFVTELVGVERKRARILAFWMGDRLGTPFEYDLAHTPCALVFEQGKAYHSTSVQEIYPEDKDLAALGAVGYLGITLVDSSDKPIGHLCVLDDKPLCRENAIISIMNVFAARAAAELERKRTEEALRENEQQMRLFMLATNDSIWNWDMVTGRVTRSGFERAFGYSVEEMDPSIDWWKERLHPDDRERVTSTYQDAIARGSATYFYEYRFRRRDGSYAVISDHAYIVRDGTGIPVRMLGAMTDVTERKRAEEALQESRQRMELALRGADLGVWDLHIPTGHVVYNRQWGEMLGYAQEDLQPHINFWKDLIHPDDSIRVNALWQAHLAGHTTLYQTEHRLRNKSGGWQWVLTYGQVLERDQTGKPLRALGIHMDVTERKRAEDALRESEHWLSQLLEDRERISRDLHDNIIQTLYAIGLNIEDCQRLFGKDSKKAGKVLHRIIGDLNGVIRDVRSYVTWTEPQISGGQQFIDAIEKLARTMHGTHQLHFHLKLDQRVVSRLTPEEAGHLLYIVREAMSNSLRHSKAQSGRVSLEQQDGRMRLQVEDDGVGFSLDGRERGGAGLRNITARAEELGAKLTIVSEPGQGVRIVLDIPGEREHASA